MRLDGQERAGITAAPAVAFCYEMSYVVKIEWDSVPISDSDME
jgi:hypothetical protein